MSGLKQKQAITAPETVEVPHYDVVALVLQGGGALGAYQAGVYEGLHDAGIRPTWLAGISIGALNAAVIAGAPEAQRVERLREFWETICAVPVDWRVNEGLVGNLPFAFDLRPLHNTRAHTHADLGRDEAPAALEQASRLAGAAREAFRQIGDGVAPENVPNAVQLREHTWTLRDTGLFGRLSGSYRQAKQSYARILPGQKAKPKQMADTLEAALAWRTSMTDFESFVAATPCLKALAITIDAPFDRFIEIARWMAAIEAATPPTVDGALEIRKGLLAADNDTIQVLNAFAGAHRANLQALLGEGTAILEAALDKLKTRAEALKLITAVATRAGWRSRAIPRRLCGR